MSSRIDPALRTPSTRRALAAWMRCFFLALLVGVPAGVVQAGDHVPGQVLVRYRDAASAAARLGAERAIAARSVRRFAIAPIELLDLGPGADVEAALARLRSDPAVAYAEPNYRIRAALVPDDPLFPEQHALRNLGFAGGTAGADVHAVPAWDLYTGHADLKVGVLDTGVDFAHLDLADNVWVNEDEARGIADQDDDGNGYIDDVHGWSSIDQIPDVTDYSGHGTQVAGAIGAVGNNGRGIAGLLWRCRIVPIKVMRSPLDGDVAAVIDGLDYAVALGIRIVCNAWTMADSSQALLDAIGGAGAGGMLFVTAAGNESLDLDVTPRYPACFDSPYILDVAASDANDELASFSNYGTRSVDLAAPGKAVVTTQAGGVYTSVNGTSLSAGYVAAACALALGRTPTLTNLELKDRVVRSAEPRPGLIARVRTDGRLNAFGVVSDRDLVAPAAIFDLAVEDSGSNSVALTWTAPGDDDTSGTATGYELRYSTSPITADNFAAATLAPSPPPSRSGTRERVVVSSLALRTGYWFAIRAIDEALNTAPISNVVATSTLGPPAIAVTPARLGAALVTGGNAIETFQIANVGEGTLEFEIPTPQVQGVRQDPPPLERARAKGEPDGAPRPAAIESAGGPDAFGYLWSDSDALYGPRFRWVDLTALGPALPLSGDDSATVAIPMGLSFPFYGATYDSVSISTNGYLSFLRSAAVFDNHEFPTALGAPAMVAPMWDDFDLGAARRIYARKVDERFVVSWVGVERARAAGVSYTFQAMLFPTGEIRFQYLSLGSAANSASVGIQNADRAIGLDIAYNLAYLRDSLAIRIRPVTQWITIAPGSGRVRAGESTTVVARFDAVDLPQAGLYAEIAIQSNDPARPATVLPVHLYVIGSGDLDVSTAPIAFDTVVVGAPASRTITLFNRGRLWLRVSAIATGDASLIAPSGPFDLRPGGSRTFLLRYDPRRAGALSSAVEIWSNDLDWPHRVIPVTATAVMPPVAEVDPESLVVEVFTNADTTRLLRLANLGGSTLAYRTEAIYPELQTPARAPRAGAPERFGGPDAYGYTFRDSDEPGGPAFEWIDLGAGAVSVPMSGDDANSGPFPIGFGFPFYGNLHSSFRVSTNGFVSLSSASADYVNRALPNGNAPENLIAPFWDDLVFGGQPRIFYAGDSARMVIEFRGVSRYTEASPNTFQVILRREGHIEFQYLSIGTPHPDSCTVGIQNDEGSDGLTVAHDQVYVRSGLAVRIQPPRQFLTVTPEAGFVAAGDSIDLTLRLDSAGLVEGEYRARIRFTTNDLVRPEFDVPVTLRVRGKSHLVAAPDSLDFGDVYVGHPRARTFAVQNIGTARLEVSSIVPQSSAYRVAPASLSLAPAEEDTVRVSLEPSAPGDFASSLVLVTNDPDRPLVTIPLTGRALAPPEIAVSPDSLTAAAATAEDPETRVVTRTLVLENLGAGELVWSATPRLADPQAPDAAARPAPASARLDALPAKGAPDLPEPPSLAAGGGPDAFGYAWIDSDESGGPAFDWIDVAAVGTRVPFTRDDQISAPFALPFPFEFYGQAFDSVRVCTNGWLSFTSGDSTYANVRLPNDGHRSPENLVAPLWDDLDVRRGGRVYVHGDASRFVVSFLEVPHWLQPGGVSPGGYTFQAVLFPNGAIDFQYLSLRDSTRSATVGIQDGAKRIGLTVAHNQGYLRDGLRVRISRRLDWLTPLTASGSIAPGERDTIEVRFDATRLEDGVYFGALEIASNDPVDSLIAIPARFRVGAGAAIAAGIDSSDDTRPEAHADLPRVFAFARAGLHPARGVARFELALPERRPVEVAVFDVRGARVRRVVHGELAAGRHPLAWDGADAAGHPAGAGVYFVRATAGAWRATLRVSLIR